MSENSIAFAIAAWLIEHDIIFRFDLAADLPLADKRLAAKLRNMHGKRSRGWPDLTIYPKGGKPIFVELKTEKGRPTAAQLERHEELRERGYTVLLTYGYKQTIKELKKWLS